MVTQSSFLFSFRIFPFGVVGVGVDVLTLMKAIVESVNCLLKYLNESLCFWHVLSLNSTASQLQSAKQACAQESLNGTIKTEYETSSYTVLATSCMLYVISPFLFLQPSVVELFSQPAVMFPCCTFLNPGRHTHSAF